MHLLIWRGHVGSTDLIIDPAVNSYAMRSNLGLATKQASANNAKDKRSSRMKKRMPRGRAEYE